MGKQLNSSNPQQNFIICDACYDAYEIVEAILQNKNDKETKNKMHKTRHRTPDYNAEGFNNRHFAYRWYIENILNEKFVI